LYLLYVPDAMDLLSSIRTGKIGSIQTIDKIGAYSYEYTSAWNDFGGASAASSKCSAPAPDRHDQRGYFRDT
jgi:hypothetical protein